MSQQGGRGPAMLGHLAPRATGEDGGLHLAFRTPQEDTLPIDCFEHVGDVHDFGDGMSDPAPGASRA